MKKQINYTIGDFLIQLKNSAMAGNKKFSVRHTKFVYQAAKCLQGAGYIENIEKSDDRIFITLVFKNKQPLLYDLKLVSKPGMRVYMNIDEMQSQKGPFLLLLTTSKGVMMSDDAFKKNLGGEVVAKIW